MRRLIRRSARKSVRRDSGSPRLIDARQALRDTGTWLRDAGARASVAGERAYRRALGFSHESPGTVALVALGAGVGIGVLCSRQLTRRQRERGLLSSLAAVVARAVSDRRR